MGTREVVLTATGVARSFGLRQVLVDATLSIHAGDRIGVVGLNGSGKTTLGRLLAGTDEPDDGTILRKRDATVGYLEQVPRLEAGKSARDVVLGGLAQWSEVKARYDECSAQLSAGGDVTALVEEQTGLAEEIERLGGWDMDHRADAMLGHLGIVDPDHRVDEMSGGEQRRVALARLLVSRPTVAILDEPTNHLDVETIDWLERHLSEDYPGALVLITHDRYLLDHVAERTVEVTQGHLHLYQGGYEAFLQAKAEREAHARRTEANRQNFLRRELEWLRRQPKARTTKSKSRVARAEAVLSEQGPAQQRALQLQAQATRTGRTILETSQLAVEIGGQRLVNDLTLALSKGERVGIVGRNGIGKTTLLRTLLGDHPAAAGEVRRGKNTKPALLDQTRGGLDDTATVFETVSQNRTHVEVGSRSMEVRSWLEHFGFRGLEQRQYVGKLSGGERARVALAKLLSEPSNLLVLDEPTNDLDVETLGALESLLVEFEGTALVVTHDRYFLDRVATSILAFEGEGRVEYYVGNYSIYRKLRAKADAEAKAADEPQKPAAPTPPAPASRPSGLSYAERKELAALEVTIENAEAEVTRIEAQLADPQTYEQGPEAGRELGEALTAARAEVERLMQRWEELEARATEPA